MIPVLLLLPVQSQFFCMVKLQKEKTSSTCFFKHIYFANKMLLSGAGAVLEHEPPGTVVMEVSAIDGDGTFPNNR